MNLAITWGAGALAAASTSSCRRAGGGGGSSSCLRQPPAACTMYRPVIRTFARVAASQRNVSQDAVQDGNAAPAAWSGTAPTSAVGAAVQPLPSRLQREVEALVGLDVEYTHLRLPESRHVSLPVEVCAVDASGRVLLYTHFDPLEDALAHTRWEHKGGHHPTLWQGGTPLSEVRRQLAALLEGRILVGHHLKKDLGALGLSHPEGATRDTLQYRELQGRRGSGRKLRDLSAEKLGRRIQSSRRHSPREDAQAALDLYIKHIHFDRRNWSYEDLVEQELAAILASASSGEDESSAGEEGGESSS